MTVSANPGQVRLAIVVAFALSVLTVYAMRAPLDWDESVYAAGGRALVGDGPSGDAVFPLYRSVGMQLVAAPGVLLGGSDHAMRALPVALSILALWLFGALGCRVVGPWPAALASASLLCSRALIARSAELLSDIPSLVFYALALALALSELGRESGPRRRLLLVAPLVAASFYLRYGNALLFAVTALAVVALGDRRALWRARWLLLATVAATAALLVPHLWAAQAQTGQPWGIMTRAREVAGLRYVGQGFVDLGRRAHVIGPLLCALAIVGAVRGARIAWRCRGSDEHRAERILWLIGALDLLLMGFTFHGRPRFVFAPLLMLALVGAPAVSARICRYRWFAAAAVIALAAVITYGAARHAHWVRRDTRPIVAVATAMRSDAGGRPCSALGSMAPPLTWYSGCAVYTFGARPWVERLRVLRTERRYVVFMDGVRREPDESQRGALLPHLELVVEVAPTGGTIGRTRLYRVID